MKTKTANSIVPTTRCTHHTATGRRCRLSVSDAHSSLCRQHRAEQLQEQSADHHLELVRNFEGFQTAQGINISLKHLYALLAQNRISPRRASVLAYINSLLLRTLPQIDADRAAGIIDPTKPKTINVSVVAPVEDVATGESHKSQEVGLSPAENETTAKAQDANIGPAPVSGIDSHAELATNTALDTDADEEPISDPGYKSYWDTLPEPDPTKKPS